MMAEFWLQTFPDGELLDEVSVEPATVVITRTGIARYIKTQVIAHEPPDAGVSPPLT